MFGFKKKVAPVAEQDDIKSRRERWISFIEESCKKHLSDISNFKHPDWEKAETAEDFRTLVTMYTAACAAYEQHADQMFSQWIKFAKGVDIDAEKTTEFYFMVNRRFSHLAQVRCFLDYQLKLTLVPADIRLKTLPQLAKLLAHLIHRLNCWVVDTYILSNSNYMSGAVPLPAGPRFRPYLSGVGG